MYTEMVKKCSIVPCGACSSQLADLLRSLRSILEEVYKEVMHAKGARHGQGFNPDV